jgi:hypothetical protein
MSIAKEVAVISRRRDFVPRLPSSACLLAATASQCLIDRARRIPRSGKIMAEQRKVVTPSPENSETPLEAVRGWVTPTRLFFVRNHFDVPQIDAASLAAERDRLR